MSSRKRLRVGDFSRTSVTPTAPASATGGSKAAVISTLPSESDAAETLLRAFAPIAAKHAPELGEQYADRETHTLILGTMPSPKSYGGAAVLTAREILLRGGDGPQNYGNPRNCFFDVIGSAVGFDRCRTPYPQQCSMLTAAGYAVWDVLRECQRPGGAVDGNIVAASEVAADIAGFVSARPSVQRLCFAQTAATFFKKPKHFGKWLKEGVVTADDGSSVEVSFYISTGPHVAPETVAATMKMFGKFAAVQERTEAVPSKPSGAAYPGFPPPEAGLLTSTLRREIELVVLPSTSPASAKQRPPEKEMLWHRGCFQLREPPPSYTCPACVSSDGSTGSTGIAGGGKGGKGGSSSGGSVATDGSALLPNAAASDHKSGAPQGEQSPGQRRHWLHNCHQLVAWRKSRRDAAKVAAKAAAKEKGRKKRSGSTAAAGGGGGGSGGVGSSNSDGDSAVLPDGVEAAWYI